MTMRTKLLLYLFLSFSFCLLTAQVPQGFNYQAIARSSNGKEIVNTALQVKISVLTDTTNFYLSGSGTYLWEEQQNVTTNSFGLFSLTVGNPAATKVQGSASSFSSINWNSGPLFLGAKVYYQGVWLNMGTSKFGSVPYAKVASTVAGPIQKLSVKGTATSPDTALFEVKNINGQTVFAVYNEGVRAYVDNGIVKGGTKGGFAIGGFETAKAGSQTLFMISPDSARIYVDETAVKGTKGGFAIGGFNTAKGIMTEFMKMTPSNYFIGHKSGQSITTGIYNSTMGYESGKALTTGTNNVLIGYQSGAAVVGGTSNVFIGSQAGFTNGGGGYNVFIGTQAGYSNKGGLFNIAVGRQAGYLTTASSNIFLGDLTGYYNTTGSQNVMIGDWAGYHNTLGYKNIFLGAEAGWYNTEGTNNIFLGYRAGYSNTLGYDNIAIGNLAGQSNLDGTYNIMIGSKAGNLNTSGDFNTIMGYQAGRKTTGNWNTMLGYLAGDSTLTGGSQVLLGYQAGRANTSGWNTMVGSLAGGQSGTGTYNTYLGLAAGEQATGDYNVFIGRWAGRFEGVNSNKLVIETRYEGTDNSNNALIYGDFLSRYVKVNGQLGTTASVTNGYAANFKNTGLTSTSGGLSVTAGTTGGTGTNYMIDFYNGGGTYRGSILLTNGALSLYSVSDARLKENVTETGIDALKILKDLKVVDYNFLDAKDTRHTGYIAQDALKVLPEMVQYNEKEDVYAISPSTLIPILHKAIQDQQKEIEELKALIISLSSQIKK
jgi:hypothetical protein